MKSGHKSPMINALTYQMNSLFTKGKRGLVIVTSEGDLAISASLRNREYILDGQ